MEAHNIQTVAARYTTKPIAAVNRITDGSINTTFEVVLSDGSQFILQQMAPIFDTSVMDNLALVEPFAKATGITIPHGVPTLEGERYIEGDHGVWFRALTFIPGKTIHDGISPAGAKSAGRLVGQFHSALAQCEAPLAIAINHFHETHYYIERMKRVAAESTNEQKRATLQPIVEEIAAIVKDFDIDTRTLPQRIIHADLKVSNIRFNDQDEAVALIDMDTMMRGSIVTEMGDALRSWCGTAGEDNSNQVFDESICKAAIAGYIETASGITDEEIAAIPEGIKILTIELASRFVTDAYEETYFALSSKYPSLYEQTKTRAENQLRFLKAYEAKRHLL